MQLHSHYFSVMSQAIYIYTVDMEMLINFYKLCSVPNPAMGTFNADSAQRIMEIVKSVIYIGTVHWEMHRISL